MAAFLVGAGAALLKTGLQGVANMIAPRLLVAFLACARSRAVRRGALGLAAMLIALCGDFLVLVHTADAPVTGSPAI